MRKKVVAANWKMNKTPQAVSEFLQLFDYEKAATCFNVQTIICPSFPYLMMLHEFYSTKGIFVGAQNVSQHQEGAFTGEVSANMLSEMKITHCIVGHSERRQYFDEDDKMISEKVNILLSNNVQPVFCCGELLEQRNSGKQFDIVETQISNALFHLNEQQFSRIIIAYEPVWAIGTGVNATSEQAQEMHCFIRGLIKKQFGESVAENTQILYGGSCNSSNAAELFQCEDVDGGLVGGASLKPDEFIKIILIANE